MSVAPVLPLIRRPLAEGWRYQRDTAAYVQRFDADGLRAALAKAVRYRDM